MADDLASDFESFRTGGAPSLADDFESFRTSPQPKKPEGFFAGVKQVGSELAEGVRGAVQGLRATGLTFNQREADNLTEGISRAQAAGDTKTASELQAQLETRLANVQESAGQIAASEAKSTFKARPVVQAIAGAKTAGEAWEAFKIDPMGAIIGVTAQSAPTMVPALLAGVFGGPVAGALTMGGTSAGTEFGSSLLDYAQDRGVTSKDPAEIQKFFSDPDHLKGAMAYAATRGGIIGSFDLATAGLASKTLVPAAIKGTLARQAVNIPAQMTAQAAGGAGGEAAAQLATKGEIDQPGAVMLEAIGELGGAPAEVLGMSREIRSRARETAPAPPTVEQQAEKIFSAGSIDEAIAAATELSTANTQLDSAIEGYMGGTPPVTAREDGGLAAPTSPVEITERDRQAIDRQAALTGESLTAATEFDRQNAAAQAATARGTPAPGPAAEFADLTPMNPREAKQRLVVLRDQAAQEGGNALDLQIVSHPSQKGALAIGRKATALPDLNLPAAAPTISQPAAQQRIESAALAGSEQARRSTPDEQGRQAIVTRAMQAIEERGGVASPYEAQVLREANMGQPFDRVDPSLAPPLRQEEALTQATGLAVGRAPRETVAQTPQEPSVAPEQQAATERANERGMAGYAASVQERRSAATAAQEAAAQAAEQPAAPPSVDTVVAALKVAPFQRTAAQKAVLNTARSRFNSEQLRALEAQANAPATLDFGQQFELQRLRESEKTRGSTARGEARVPETQPTLQVLKAGEQLVSPASLESKPSSKISVDGGGVAKTQRITKEVFGTIERLARVYGARVKLFEGGDLDGFFDAGDKNTVYLNADSSKPHLLVFGHELLHLLKASSPKAYEDLRAAIEKQMKDGALEKFAKDYGQEADVEEFIADLVGNRMQEGDFWEAVFGGMDQPAATRLGAAIINAVNKMKRVLGELSGFKTDSLVKDLDAVREAVQDAMRVYARERRGERVTEEASPVEAAPRTPDDQPRDIEGRFKPWSDADELAAASAQLDRASPRRAPETQAAVDSRKRERLLRNLKECLSK